MPVSKFKRYFSPLGFKIASLIGLFMILPSSGYIILHESREGLSVALNPYFWAWVSANFVILMVILSKVVIIPLKKLEIDMHEIEQGRKNLLSDSERDDEIGRLADKFNSVHKLVSEEIRARTVHFSVLNRFIHASSGVLKISGLMESFFNILVTAVEFRAGAYAFCYRNHEEGGIFGSGVEEGPFSEKVRAHMLDWMRSEDRGMSREAVQFEFTNLQNSSSCPRHTQACALFPVDFTLECFGAKTGVITLFFDSGGPDPDDMKVCEAMVHHVRIIMERLLSHIFAEEKRLQNILSSMSEGVFILDNSGSVTSINQKGISLLEAFCGGAGCLESGEAHSCASRAQGEPCIFEILSRRIENMRDTSDNRAYSHETSNEDGMTLLFSATRLLKDDGEPEGYVITARDITQDKLIQKKLNFSSKLAALGEMAAGIAHEVNNPLQAMMSRVETFEKKADEEVAKGLDCIKDDIMRIKGIVQNLLIFSKDQPADTDVIEVDTVIDKVVDLLRYQFRVDNIRIEHYSSCATLYVRCNKNLFQQVLLNLLQNARDAITGSGKGSTVNIRTFQSSQDLVAVEVEDDGPGIPESIAARIFDPFFTTKDFDHGTGLGLSVSKRIMEMMSGSIEVANRPGFTRFRITIPKAKEEKNDVAAEFIRQDENSALDEKSVLIVDDECDVASTVKEALAPLVSSIDCAKGGDEAFEKLNSRDYDLLLVDLKMPGKNGIEFFRAMKELKPGLCRRMVFITGDTKTESTRAFLNSSGCPYLFKPFTIRELSEAFASLDDMKKAAVK